MAEYKGIDVSRWQGSIDWKQVKNSGIQFAILKAGGSDSGVYKDSTFETNYKNARAVGMPIGCYYFVGAGFTNTEAGLADAKNFEKMIEGKIFEYPVYLDLEATNPQNKKGATDASVAFLDYLISKGYRVGIYASDISGFQSRLDYSRVKKYDQWVARYGSKPTYAKDYQMWQHSSTGSVPGIRGNVDMNVCYKNYLGIDMGLSAEPTAPEVQAPAAADVTTPLKHKVGDKVSFTKLFVSSMAVAGVTPRISSGTITKVFPGTLNPYLINGGTGFTNDSYISNAGAPAMATAGAKYKVVAFSLNIRSGPGTSFSRTGLLYNNNECYITEQQNGFGKLADGRGWVSMSYLRKI